MPGYLLHFGAQVKCSHAGLATPSAINARVKVNGQPTVTIAASYAVAGCTLPPPSAGNGPCATAQWTTAATRLVSNGQPLLLLDSKATCAPSGTPLLILKTQTRVTGI